MKHYFFLLVIICLSFPALNQTASYKSTAVSTKRSLDSAAIAGWADLLWSEPVISSNGKYFMYPLENLPVGGRTLVIQSTEGTWKREFIGASSGIFSFDSKYAIFQFCDTLFFVSLGTAKQECVTGVSFYTYPKTQMDQLSFNSGKLIVYSLGNGNIFLKNLVNGRQFSVTSVSDFLLSESGKTILVKKDNKETAIETLEWVDVASNQSKQVWSNKGGISRIRSYQLDEAVSQVVFLTQNKGDARSNIIWYYKPGMPAAEIKVSDELLKRNDGMLISNKAPSFSKTGNYIFFTLQPKPEPLPKADPKAVQVDVWNYKDLILQHMQLYYKSKNEKIPELKIKTEITASIEIANGQIRQLENDSEKIVGNYAGDIDFIITSSYRNNGDRSWLRKGKGNYYIRFLKDGRKKYLTTDQNILPFLLSPDKKFLIYFDRQQLQFMSFVFATGEFKNISSSIPFKLTKERVDELINDNTSPAEILGWLENGNLLIYDNYDIWMLDPSGKNEPKNITNGYGRANNVKFDLIPKRGTSGESPIYPVNKPLLLSGFWVNTKQNGFFKLDIRKTGDPLLLSLHSSLIYASSQQTDAVECVSKAKADHADVWIVKKQTMAEAPNFYLTKDFKSFKQLTNIQPQRNYCWATSELITWKMPDGRPCQGILYKPEDLNAGKKYPVIVHYYEKVSGALHEFHRPDLIDGGLNIPWFLSRGYIVFTPDIHYTINKVSQSVVNSVVPGIRELLKRSFVDSSAIGIQGQSFGGYETNVLITETHLFAAAAEGAGQSNKISNYGSLLPTPAQSGQGIDGLEKGGQYRVDGLLWENQSAYIENSPIFKADKVTTPLLIRHNKGDQAVPWGQAVELFIALRRLNKPVWMLQYDGEGHGNNNEKTKSDHTIRLTQFFDHYLKGAPAPKWMTQGVPAALKGLVTGYELDPLGSCAANCSNTCKVCKKWNEQYTRTPGMFSEAAENWHLDKDLK